MKLDVILVPVDFSDVTQSVYTAAGKLAAKVGAKVVVLNVTEPEMDYVGMAPPQVFASADENIQKAAESSLIEAAEFFTQLGVKSETIHVMGSVLPTILEEAKKRDVGMIVLGSHGHGAIYSLLVGSIAEGVMRHAKVPVLVVPDLRSGSKVKE